MLLYISYLTSILSHISYTRTHHCSLSTHHYTLLYTSVHSTNLHYYTMHYMYCSYIPLYPLHMLIDHHLTLHNYTYHTLALVHIYILLFMYHCFCTCCPQFTHSCTYSLVQNMTLFTLLTEYWICIPLYTFCKFINIVTSFTKHSYHHCHINIPS